MSIVPNSTGFRDVEAQADSSDFARSISNHSERNGHQSSDSSPNLSALAAKIDVRSDPDFLLVKDYLQATQDRPEIQDDDFLWDTYTTNPELVDAARHWQSTQEISGRVAEAAAIHNNLNGKTPAVADVHLGEIDQAPHRRPEAESSKAATAVPVTPSVQHPHSARPHAFVREAQEPFGSSRQHRENTKAGSPAITGVTMSAQQIPVFGGNDEDTVDARTWLQCIKNKWIGLRTMFASEAEYQMAMATDVICNVRQEARVWVDEQDDDVRDSFDRLSLRLKAAFPRRQVQKRSINLITEITTLK